jgi:type III restriction enzyme
MTKELHQVLTEELGKRFIDATEVPLAITANVNPSFPVRDYQLDAFKYFLSYWNESFEGKPRQNHHLLFHMATGSGKTLIMAGLIAYLYEQGYRNFLFFVNSRNIVDKTRDNFLNKSSSKYLFSDTISIGDKRVNIREAESFQSTNDDEINIVFETIQGLHIGLNTPRENSITFDDFEGKKIVLISDEAHHINADTKKGKVDQGELIESISWESTVEKIFKASPENILLEFTATVDFSDEDLNAKYKPKLIFDYPLKDFRKDGYSKEVKVMQSDAPPMDRALQAILLSQYRRKVFEKYGKDIKPVILFKSKTIKESKDFFAEFQSAIQKLSGNDLLSIRDSCQNPEIQHVFKYLDQANISLENLAEELKEDFSEDKLISVNSKEESEEKQIAVNSLETNAYRAVFAVDKLNEGWDVLNLFDIVRLYDTRDAKANKVGKTTMSEAQLIGRGARYCPFKIEDDQQMYMRKFDSDLENELRVCEELYYHSAYNPKYIQELNVALQEIGIKAKETIERKIILKDSFKQSQLYKAGHIFLNKQKKYSRDEVIGLDSSLITKVHQISLRTGFSTAGGVFELTPSPAGAINRKHAEYALLSFGEPIIRKAMQRLEFYEFSNLKRLLPNLTSVKEFIESDGYLGKIKIEVSGLPEHVNNLTTENKLDAAIQVLDTISGVIASDKIEFKGTNEFFPRMINEVFTDKSLNFMIDEGSDKEFGKSMLNPTETAYHLDLTSRDWYVFSDCFGTSEEKLLIQYIDKKYDELAIKFSSVYLLRNERHFKIYNFVDGRPLEPDFVLFLVGKESVDTKYYQVFIEPKGAHLLKADEWKEDFLESLKAGAYVEQLFANREYIVWGMPFFNHVERMPEFDAAYKELVELGK